MVGVYNRIKDLYDNDPWKFLVVFVIVMMFLCSCFDIISHDTYWMGLLIASCIMYVGESFKIEFEDDEDDDDEC